MTLRTRALATTVVAAALAASLAPATVQAEGNSRITTIYFTRHAEKKTTVTKIGDTTSNYSIAYDENDEPTVTRERGRSDGDRLSEVCMGMDDDCAEELNAFGLARADLLVEFLDSRGIIDELDAVYSSHKFRTYQTVMPSATAADLDVIQLPAGETELSVGTSASECPTIHAIRNAPEGSTLLVAGHSGTLYDIMGDGNSECAGLGLLTDDDPSSDAFPKKSNGKVRDFGDLWRVSLRPNGTAKLNFRLNLVVPRLIVDTGASVFGGQQGGGTAE